ncbi:MAG: NYN domain-containing protein, partial [Planctomycetia bacterium]
SGDSDFSPLVSKLKENDKTVIGLGMKDSTSALLRDNCDEFIFYEDLQAEAEDVVVEIKNVDEQEREAFSLLIESCQALRRENREFLWSSMIKETMKRKRPSFNEASYGFSTFSRLLEAAAKKRLVSITRDSANRSYIVTRFGAELDASPQEEESPRDRDHGSSRRGPAPRRFRALRRPPSLYED